MLSHSQVFRPTSNRQFYCRFITAPATPYGRDTLCLVVKEALEPQYLPGVLEIISRACPECIEVQVPPMKCSWLTQGVSVWGLRLSCASKFIQSYH